MAAETTLDANQIADQIEAADVEAFAWLLDLEFTHDDEPQEAKDLIVLALRAYPSKAVAAERERCSQMEQVIKDAIEALEQNSTSAPIVEVLRAVIRKEGE
jgi:hypothetical protein